MQRENFEQFRELMQGVHDFYGRDLSQFGLSVWWEAMRPFDFDAVRDALNRHVVNPDTGQFLPKPADVVKMIGGRTIDGAQRAWSKVDAAVRRVGTYASVVFDDQVIHRVLTDMGGWIALGNKTDDEWPFIAKEFENRYRGYAMRSETPEFVARLIGIVEHENARTGQPIPEPILIGDHSRALAVLSNGGARSGPAMGRVQDAIAQLGQ